MTKLRKILIAILLSAAAVFTLAGCKLGTSIEDYKHDNKLVAQITYYANGGAFNGGVTVKNLYYHENDVPLNIGFVGLGGESMQWGSKGAISFERSDYTLRGWAYAQLDGDGNPVDENGNPVEGDTSPAAKRKGDDYDWVDFTNKLANGDRFYFVAVWSPIVKVKIKLVSDFDIQCSSGTETLTYKNGDVVNEYSFNVIGTMGTVNKPILEPINRTLVTDATFVELYSEPECLNLVSWPIQKDFSEEEDIEEGEDVNIYIYAKYVAGSWIVLRNADDVEDINWGSRPSENAHESAGKYYLMQDIAMPEDASPISAPNTTRCYINGNGHTISNLKMAPSETVGFNGTTSMFGRIIDTAKFENLTLKDAKFIVSSIRPGNEASSNLVDLYLISTDIAEGATFENFTFNGTLQIAKIRNVVINNIQQSGDAGEYVTNHFLFGNAVNDSVILEKYSGLHADDCGVEFTD